MMISNRSDMEGAAWQLYASTRDWTLAPTGDSATVYVQYRDAEGNQSRQYSDTIRVQSERHLYLPLIIAR